MCASKIICLELLCLELLVLKFLFMRQNSPKITAEIVILAITCNAGDK